MYSDSQITRIAYENSILYIIISHTYRVSTKAGCSRHLLEKSRVNFKNSTTDQQEGHLTKNSSILTQLDPYAAGG